MAKAPQKKDDKQSKPVGSGTMWYQWSAAGLASQNKFLSKIVLIESGTIAVLVLTIVIMFSSFPSPKYFSVTPDLRVAELMPLDQPFVTPAALTNWTARVLAESLSFDFRHWRKVVQASEMSFSKAGFKGFLAALKTSGIVNRVESKRLVTSLLMDGSAVISAEGPIKGVYHWQIEVPVILEYEGASGVTNKQDLLAKVLVSRQDTRLKPDGIAIEQLTLLPRRTNAS